MGAPGVGRPPRSLVQTLIDRDFTDLGEQAIEPVPEVRIVGFPFDANLRAANYAHNFRVCIDRERLAILVVADVDEHANHITLADIGLRSGQADQHAACGDVADVENQNLASRTKLQLCYQLVAQVLPALVGTRRNG